MEYNEKLRHLSDLQIQEVIRKYEDKKYKLADIIEEYSIDVKPKGFYNILPLQVMEEKCEYCSCNLVKKRENRSGYYYKNENIYCENCGHTIISCNWRNEKCYCEGCKEKEISLLNERRALIEEYYGGNSVRFEFDKLPLKYQIALYNAMITNENHNTHVLAAMQKPTIDLIKDYNMMLENNLILVSPESSINAFDEDEFPRKVNISLATFDINVDFTDEIVTALNDKKYFSIPEYRVEEKVDIWRELIYRDVLDKFKTMLEERDLELHISEKADEKFRELLMEVSYTKLITICYRVATKLSDRVITGEMNRRFAVNTAYTNVTSYFRKAEEEGWIINDSKYEYAGEKLKTFIRDVLGKNYSILKEIASADSLNYRDKWEDDDPHIIMKF